MSILTKLPQLSSNLSPVTQNKIVVTNNYDMPILTEFLLQLNPSQSPELKSIMKTSNSLQSPHKFVKMMKVNSSPTTTTNISIPNTADDKNTTIDEKKYKNPNPTWWAGDLWRRLRGPWVAAAETSRWRTLLSPPAPVWAPVSSCQVLCFVGTEGIHRKHFVVGPMTSV